MISGWSGFFLFGIDGGNKEEMYRVSIAMCDGALGESKCKWREGVAV